MFTKLLYNYREIYVYVMYKNDLIFQIERYALRVPSLILSDFIDFQILGVHYLAIFFSVVHYNFMV